MESVFVEHSVVEVDVDDVGEEVGADGDADEGVGVAVNGVVVCAVALVGMAPALVISAWWERGRVRGASTGAMGGDGGGLGV